MFKPSRLALLTLSALMAGAVQAEPISTPLFLSINNQPTDAGLQQDQGKDTYKVTANLKREPIRSRSPTRDVAAGPHLARRLLARCRLVRRIHSMTAPDDYRRCGMAGDYDFIG